MDPITLTPVRKTDHLTNIKRSHGTPEKEWTTARCQRLLRTLTSRVAMLKKEIDLYSDRNMLKERESKQNITGVKPIDLTKTKKKLSRTYGKSRKFQKSCTKSSQTILQINDKKNINPGEVLVPTPLLARVRTGQYEISQDREEKAASIKHKARLQNKKFQLSESLQELRQHTTTLRYNAYKGIYQGLETIIHTTSQIKIPVKSKGSKTLMETTLELIPQYIIEQQKILQIHMQETNSKTAIDDRDISCEIYDDLESLSPDGKGWKFLRNVVRAHGVQVVCDAIKEGLFDVEYCGTLISLCIRLGATEEAQKLLSSLLSSNRYPRPETLCESPGRQLSLLLKFTEHTNQPSFLYRELNFLISKEILHLEWLGTEYFGPVWTGLIQSLSTEPIDHEALLLIDTALHAFLKSPEDTMNVKDENNDRSTSTQTMMNDAVKNTFSSLLTILVSIVLLHRGPEVTSPIKTSHSVYLGVSHIISLIKGYSINYTTNRHMNVFNLLLFFAALIIDKDHTQCVAHSVHLQKLKCSLENFETGTSNRGQISLFICEVSRCCGRGTAGSGFDYLQLIHHHLENFASESRNPNFLNGIIFDSAFAFARNFPDHQHVNYAKSMGASYCTTSHQLVANLASGSSNFGTNSVCGLRWEEGIGEWVTATPANSKSKRETSEIAECLNNQTPTYQMSKRRCISLDTSSLQLSVIDYPKLSEGLEESNVSVNFCSKLRPHILDLPVDNDNFIMPIHVPNFEQINMQAFAEQILPTGINQISGEIHGLLQYPNDKMELKSEQLLKNFKNTSHSPILAGFASFIRSPELSRYPDYITTENASENGKHHLKANSQLYLLDSSPCKNPSLRHRSGNRWHDAMNDDEDELSLLSTISRPASKKQIAQDFSLGMKTGLNKAIVLKKRINCQKTQLKKNSTFKMKKKYLHMKHVTRYHTRQHSNGSEDELCS